MSRSRDDVDRVHAEVDTDIVVVADHNDEHPEGQPRHVGGPAGLLARHQPASPVRVAAETILEQVQVRLGSHHQQVSLGKVGGWREGRLVRTYPAGEHGDGDVCAETVPPAPHVHQPGLHVKFAPDQRPPALPPYQPPRPPVKSPQQRSSGRVRLQPGVHPDCLGLTAQSEAAVVLLPVREGFLRVPGVPGPVIVTPGLLLQTVLAVDTHPVLAVLHTTEVQVRLWT